MILSTYGSNNGDVWLKAIGCDAIDTHSAASVINWGGAIWNHSIKSYTPNEQEDAAIKAKELKVLKQPVKRSSFDIKVVSPSKVKCDKQQFDVELTATFADRISATAQDGRDSTIGDFIHHVMCLWNGDKSIIGKLAKSYGVVVDAEAIATSIENFWSWMDTTYGKATQVDRELTFSYTNELGQKVSGEIDLVYHTADGDVLVDYKTYQGSVAHLTDKSSDFYAGKYGGQLSLYGEALKRGGSTIRESLICYLSLGVIVEVK